ncbi:hypothetical protein ABPG72_015180 [Tetrahymena utriculariae]
MSQDQADHIPVKEGSNLANENQEQNKQSQRVSKIQQALSSFRSGVEQIYTESRERSLGRLKESEDEMQRKFSIQKVINNDVRELQNIGQDNLTNFLSDEHNEILTEAQKLDCYVIREQIKSSKNREEEEERIYRQQIEKLHKKNQELEEQIQQKKRQQRINSKNSSLNSLVKTSNDIAPKNVNPTVLPFPSIEQKMQQFDISVFNNPMQGLQDQVLNTNQYLGMQQDPKQAKNQKGRADFKPIQTQIDNIPAHAVEYEQEQPDIQVVYEGEKRDLNKCLRKFAKKIFYLQRMVQDLTAERDKWRTQFESVDNQYREYRIKYEEVIEQNKLQEKQMSENKINLEKYKTMAVALEEEVNKLRLYNQSSGDQEVQIVEKLIEKPIEIVKHVVLEKIVEKPIEIIRTIEAPPIEIEKIIEKIVEVPVERVVEKVVQVPFETIVEKVIEVPKIEIVEKEKIIEVPRPEYIEKLVHVEKPVYIDRPQIVKEIIETKDHGLERELMMVREDYHRLQVVQENQFKELEDWKIKCIRLEDQFRTNEADKSVMIEKDRSVLMDEIKNSHQTIDNLRDRIEMLYKEISMLTENNNRKNIEMSNQIRFLEEQLALSAPRIISTTSYQGLPAYQPVPPPIVENSTAYYKTTAPVYANQGYSSQQQPLSNPQFNNSQSYQQTFQQTNNQENLPYSNSRYQL